MFRKFIAVLFETWHTKTSIRQRAGTGRHFQARPDAVRWHLGPYSARPVKISEFQAQARRAVPCRTLVPTAYPRTVLRCAWAGFGF